MSKIYSQTVISGKATSFANEKLYLYKLSERITYTPELLASASVDADGFFRFEFEANEITKVYIDMPVIKAFMFVEPNKKYGVRIPKKVKMTDDQFLDPYFQKKYYPIYIVEHPENDINIPIIAYSSFLTKQKNNLLKLSNQDNKIKYIDSLEQISDTLLSDISNQYFRTCKKTQFEMMRYYYVQHSQKYFINSFFASLPVTLNCSSYMDLLNMVFDKPFERRNSMLPISVVYKGIRAKNFVSIVDSLQAKYPKLDRVLAEVISLKGLFAKFYEESKTQTDILGTLRAVNTSEIDSYSYLVLQNFLLKTTMLMTGNPAPEFELKNKKGKLVNLKKFKNNFLYVQFFHPKSLVCQQQMSLLENYQNQKIKKLKILTVFVGDDIREMQSFLSKNKNYKWDFVFADKKSEVLKKYDVSIYPTYYLIAPNGILTDRNTPSPAANFEKFYNVQFQKYFK